MIAVMISLLCSLLFFIMCLLLIECLRRSRVTVAKRMRFYAGDGSVQLHETAAEEHSLKEWIMALVKKLGRLLRRLRRAQGLDFRMLQAGIPITGSEYIVIVGGCSLAAAVFVMMLTLNLLNAVLAAILLAVASWIVIILRIQRRRKAFTNQLGDCLTMAANALRAGFSFVQAMELITREMEDPISEEFEKVVAEMRLGNHLEESLTAMERRVASSDFALVVTAVVIQRQVGGNLAQILDTISETINDRIRMRREVMTLTAQGRASGWVLAALPIGVAFILNFINPGYLQPLFDEDIGRMAVVGAIVLEIMGFLVIQRIVDIDV